MLGLLLLGLRLLLLRLLGLLDGLLLGLLRGSCALSRGLLRCAEGCGVPGLRCVGLLGLWAERRELAVVLVVSHGALVNDVMTRGSASGDGDAQHARIEAGIILEVERGVFGLPASAELSVDHGDAR